MVMKSSIRGRASERVLERARTLSLTIPMLAASLGTSALSSFLSQILTRVYIQMTDLWLSHRERVLISGNSNVNLISSDTWIRQQSSA